MLKMSGDNNEDDRLIALYSRLETCTPASNNPHAVSFLQRWERRS
jgi:hypothetical protein